MHIAQGWGRQYNLELLHWAKPEPHAPPRLWFHPPAQFFSFAKSKPNIWVIVHSPCNIYFDPTIPAELLASPHNKLSHNKLCRVTKIHD